MNNKKEQEKNVFWEMAGYKDDGKLLPLEVPDEPAPPTYRPPSQILRNLTHSGIMRRVRMSKEKSEYKQIIYPSPSTSDSAFAPSFFGSSLPSKFMVADKSVKELKEVQVKFKILKAWKDHWPQAKVIEIIRN